MVSTPVFPSLKVTWATPVPEALRRYALDLLLTLPAYVVIFSVIWAFVARYDWPLWRYVLVVGLAQTLGDGGVFFFSGAPAMLVFLPYPMSNYHAVNVLPFLAVRDDLPPGRAFPRRALLVLPAVVATYLACGAAIRVVGTRLGLGAARLAPARAEAAAAEAARPAATVAGLNHVPVAVRDLEADVAEEKQEDEDARERLGARSREGERRGDRQRGPGDVEPGPETVSRAGRPNALGRVPPHPCGSARGPGRGPSGRAKRKRVSSPVRALTAPMMRGSCRSPSG